MITKPAYPNHNERSLIMLLQIQEYYVNVVFHDTVFLLYVVTLIVDIFTGNLVAVSQRKWNSNTGITGTLRHLALASVMVILLPMITFTTNIDGFANGVMLYVIAQYTISILENLSAMGLELHEGFAQYFEFLNPKKKEAKQENKEEL